MVPPPSPGLNLQNQPTRSREKADAKQTTCLNLGGTFIHTTAGKSNFSNSTRNALRPNNVCSMVLQCNGGDDADAAGPGFYFHSLTNH